MKLHTKAIKHILLVIFPVLLASCTSQSPRKLYPDGVGGNVFKVGQIYQNRSTIAFSYGEILGDWRDDYMKESSFRIKLIPGTNFEIVDVKKEFNGTFGRTLIVYARFYYQGKARRALVTGSGLGRVKKNVSGFNDYIIPDLSNVRRVK